MPQWFPNSPVQKEQGVHSDVGIIVWLGTQNLRWDAQRGSEVAIDCDLYDRHSACKSTLRLVYLLQVLLLVQSSLYNIKLAM